MNELLPAVINLLTQRLGLAPASLGERVLESIVRRRMTANGITSPKAYFARLTTFPEEVSALVESVVVPESWFFRYPESFNLLVEFAKERSPVPSVAVPYRVLCSPCSTGEEAYSAAIALIWSGIAPDAIEVFGTDISVGAVKKARAGVYSPSSFREADPNWFAALLNAVPVMPDGKRVVSDAIKAIVQFQELNLVEDAAQLPAGPFDVVFCRNLLIYLTEEARTKVLKRLASVMARTGRMFVGHAEGSSLSGVGLESLGRPQAFAFRRAKPKPAPTPQPIVVPEKSPTASDERDSAPPDRTPMPDFPESLPKLIDVAEIERRINAGEARPMIAELEMSAAITPTANIYLLLGTAYSMLGFAVESERAFNQAVYLDPRCYEALIQLLAAAERRGDATAAANYRRRAEKASGGQLK